MQNGPDKPVPPLIDKIWAVVTAHGEVLGEHLTYNAAFLLSKNHEHGFVVPQRSADKAKQANEGESDAEIPKQAEADRSGAV